MKGRSDKNKRKTKQMPVKPLVLLAAVFLLFFVSSSESATSNEILPDNGYIMDIPGDDEEFGSYNNTRADDTSYYAVGETSNDDELESFIVLEYNISSLGTTSSGITGLEFNVTYCHSGEGSTPDCDGDDPAEGTVSGDQDVEIYNWTGNSWVDIGNLRTDDGENEVTSNYSILSGFSDYINSTHWIRIRYEANYTNEGSPVFPQDSWLVVDYAPMTVSYDNLAPSITLNYPPGGVVTSNTSFNFNWTAVDSFDDNLTCNLSVDGVVNATNVSSLNNTPANYTVSGFSDGLHEWNVTCWDDALNVNTSETRNFSVDASAPSWSNASMNQTEIYWNDTVLFNTTWADNVELAGYVFSTNLSGSWANTSYIPFGGTSNVSENVSLITANAGSVVGWYFWANDTSGNSNQTGVQNFTVQSRPTNVVLSVNQSVYPQGRSVNYTIYIPFEARYADFLNNQPIGGANCHVTNNQTDDNITLSYNATTGNYTGKVDNYLMYDNLTFNISCSKTNYDTATNFTTANVWWFTYLWEWENTTYDGNRTTTHWLRKEPANGSLFTLTKSINASAGSNLVEQFPFCGSGKNCSFLKDYNFVGSHTMRMNLSVNDTSCKPYLCSAVKDFNFDSIKRTCAEEQVIPASTPTLLESNFSDNYTLSQGNYGVMELYLNCTSEINAEVEVYYNYSGAPANFESTHPEPSQIASYLADYTQLESNYTLGPNASVNGSAKVWITFNNTFSAPRYTHIYYLPPIISDYPNSIKPGTVYIYNSTGQLWASDNASAGAPNTATLHSNNEVEWVTETFPAFTAKNETATTYLLNALRNSENLLTDTAHRKVWNITAFSIFTRQIDVHNVTIFTNYSAYDVPDDFSFEVNVTNSSGTFDITGAVIINTTSDTITFPEVTLSEMNYLVVAEDNSSPSVTLNYPPGGVVTSNTSFNFNWTAVDSFDDNLTCNLSVDGVVNATNVSSLNNTPANYTVSGFSDGLHEWNVTCWDDALNVNTSETRNFSVDAVEPGVTLNYPPGGVVTSNTSFNFNWTAVDSFDDNLTCNLSVDGVVNATNVSSLNNTPANYTVSGFSDGLHEWNVTCWDDALNVNTSETRNFSVDAVEPGVTLNYPPGGVVTSNTSFNFNWTAVDSFDDNLTCNLSVDGVVNATNVSSLNNTPANYTVSGFSDGLHEWNVTCWDDALNFNVSETENFTADSNYPALTVQSPVNNSNHTYEILDLNYTVGNGDVDACWYVNVTGHTLTLPGCQNTSFTALQGSNNITVAVNDTANNINSSQVFFILDSTPPGIENVTSATTNESAEIRWDTSEISNGTINYGTTAALESTMSNSTIALSHFVNITGLTNNTFYYYNVTSCDIYGNCNTSGVYNFTTNQTNTPPAIILNSPANNSQFNNTNNATLNFTAVDSLSTSLNCSLYINSNLNQTNASVQNSTITNFYINVSPGSYLWRVDCTDGELSSSSETRAFNINDTLPPVIENVTNGTIGIFEAEIVWDTDEDSNSTVSYGTTTSFGNESYNTTFSKNHYILLTSLQNSTLYYYNVSSCDVYGNCNTSGVYNFTTRPLDLSVEQLIPGNNSVDGDGKVYFNCSAADDISLQNISLYVNGILNQTSQVGGTTNHSNFTVTGMADDIYYWSCKASDSENITTSPNRTLIVNTSAVPVYNETFYSGNTTNWSDLPDLSNVCDGEAVLDNPGTNKIVWNDCVNAVGADFDSFVTLSYNNVTVTFGLNNTFNSSATITMRNLSWDATPVIYKDGEACTSDECTIINYNSSTGTLVFNVSHFTSYVTQGNARLGIWDETDSGVLFGNQVRYDGQETRFFANYTNRVSGTPITVATCSINFTDSDNVMSYNSTYQIYEYNRTFAVNGTYKWNVTCSAAGRQTLTTNDTVLITNDTVAPGIATNLNETQVTTSTIRWEWTNPSDYDFNHTEVWIDNAFYANVTVNYYLATGLSPETAYEIQTRTADHNGNVNTTWVNDTATTEAEEEAEEAVPSKKKGSSVAPARYVEEEEPEEEPEVEEVPAEEEEVPAEEKPVSFIGLELVRFGEEGHSGIIILGLVALAIMLVLLIPKPKKHKGRRTSAAGPVQKVYFSELLSRMERHRKAQSGAGKRKRRLYKKLTAPFSFLYALLRNVGKGFRVSRKKQLFRESFLKKKRKKSKKKPEVKVKVVRFIGKNKIILRYTVAVVSAIAVLAMARKLSFPYVGKAAAFLGSYDYSRLILPGFALLVAAAAIAGLYYSARHIAFKRKRRDEIIPVNEDGTRRAARPAEENVIFQGEEKTKQPKKGNAGPARTKKVSKREEMLNELKEVYK